MSNLLFRNVICKGYLQRKETKHVYSSTIDDEYVEDDVSITLNQGGSCEQEIYEFVEKEFEGICVGIFTKSTKREYVDCVNDISEEQFIHTELKEPIQVAIESVLRRLEQDEKIIREMAKYIAEHTTASIDNYGASAEEWEKYFRKRCGVDE